MPSPANFQAVPRAAPEGQHQFCLDLGQEYGYCIYGTLRDLQPEDLDLASLSHSVGYFPSSVKVVQISTAWRGK